MGSGLHLMHGKVEKVCALERELGPDSGSATCLLEILSQFAPTMSSSVFSVKWDQDPPHGAVARTE